MTNINLRWRILAAAAVAAAALAGCGGGGDHTVPVPPAPTPSQEATFSVFVQTVFQNGPNSTPVSLNGDVFNFDVNDDPTAFDSLIASGSYQ